MSSCIFFLFVSSIQIWTHKSKDKLTSPHINSQDNIGFDLAKCAAQLLYGPVLVFHPFVKYWKQRAAISPLSFDWSQSGSHCTTNDWTNKTNIKEKKIFPALVFKVNISNQFLELFTLPSFVCSLCINDLFQCSLLEQLF